MAPKCRALRLVLAEAAHAPKEASLGGARDRLDGAAERVERMLQTPPPDPERDEGDGGSSEAPGA